MGAHLAHWGVVNKVRKSRAGEHSYAVVDGTVEALRVASSFVTDGLAARERVIVLGSDQRHTDTLLTGMHRRGADTGLAEAGGQRERERVRYQLPSRDTGTGGTGSAVAANLTWRVFGDSRPSRAQSVLDWAGLLGRPAGTVIDVAAAHHISRVTLLNRVREVRSRGALTPLTPLVLWDVTRSSLPTEDHLSRQRIAELLDSPMLHPMSRPA